MTTMFVARRAPAPPRVLSAVTFVRLVIIDMILAGVLWTAVPALVLGMDAAVITSGSMLPSIRPGDVVMTAPTPLDDLSPGAIVQFDHGDGRVTHRYSHRNPDGTVTTRGDANRTDDTTPLRPNADTSVARLVVPAVGLPVLWAHQRQWAVLAALAATIVFVAATPTQQAQSQQPTTAAKSTQRRRRTSDNGSWVRAAVIIPVATIAALATHPAVATIHDRADQSASWTSSAVAPSTAVAAHLDCTGEPQVTVGWQATTDPDGYDVYRINDAGAEVLLASVGADVTSYRDVADGGTYTYRIVVRYGTWASAPTDSSPTATSC